MREKYISRKSGMVSNGLDKYINQRFGRLVVLGVGEDYISPAGVRLRRVKCKCDCGNTINCTTAQLKRGKKSCGCYSSREDLTGRVFGELTVLYAVDDYVSPKGFRMSKWHCKCTCGNEKDVLGMSLKNGDTKSCGCKNKRIRTVHDPADFIGKIFGNLFVEYKIPNVKPTKYHCKCTCGNIKDVYQKDLVSGRRTHCGCKTVRKPHNSLFHDYVGQSFGKLLVIEEMEPHITPNGSKQRIVKCRCLCGNEYTTRLTSAQKSQKCRKCSNKENRIDISGNKYGLLTVLSMAEDYVSPSGHRLSRCKCICDCGNTTIVNMSEIIKGSTRSCGCLKNSAGLLKDNRQLVDKYDFEKNLEIGLDFETLTARTSQKAWWKCNDCGNSWYATIASQNDTIKHGCPYCSGRLVIKGKTDLASRKPEILNEWDFDKNEVNPDEISCYSGQKVWWKCKECGHSWKQTVSNRVGGSGCPKCNIENVNSFCEQAVYYYVKQVFPNAINSDTHLGMELDIFIPNINVAIEYDGEAWHKSKRKEQIDLRKNQLCKDNGVKLIRIREPKLSDIDDCIIFKRDNSTTNSSLDNVIVRMLNYISSSQDIDINTTRDTPFILEQYATKKHENSLAYMYPEIAAEWHPYKNGLLTPDKVSKASSHKVWWLGKCGHEWQMSVSDRTVTFVRKNGKIRKQYGCPICAKAKNKNFQGSPVMNSDTGERFKTLKEAAISYGIKSTSHIGACCRGERNTAGGYHWEYIDQTNVFDNSKNN